MRRSLALALVWILAGSSSAVAATVTFAPLESVPATGTPLIDAGDMAGNSQPDIGAVHGTIFEPFSGDPTGLFDGHNTVAVGAAIDAEAGPLRPIASAFDGMAIAFGAAPEDVAVVQSSFVPSLEATLTPPEGAKAVAIGDVDGDLDGDVISVGGGTLRASLNNGANAFPTNFTNALSCTSDYDIDTGDLDGDGRADVATVCQDGPDHRYYYSRITGVAFGTFGFVNGGTTAAGAVEVAEITGDARADVVLVRSNAIELLRSGTGGVTTVASVTGARDLAIADLDGDGTQDIGALVATGGGRVFRPYLNEGNGGSFRPGVDQPVAPTASGVELVRLTPDGAPELVVSRSGGLDVLRNAGAVAANTVDFGSMTVGRVSATVPVVVANTGAGDLTLGAPSVTGADAADFAITESACTGRTLAPEETCVVTVRMTPAAAGARAASLALPGDTAVTPTLRALSGTGVAADAGPVGPAGPAGSSGPAGSAGPAGVPGTTGPAGPVGPTGPSGAPGSPGTQGSPGRRGKRGKKGKRAQGQAGRPARPGREGREGREGRPGRCGKKSERRCKSRRDA